MKSTMSKCQLVLLTSLLCSTPVSSEPIAITNSGFEDGWTGWSDTDPSSVSGVAFSGSRSAKISGTNGRVQQTVSIEANKTYKLSAYVRGSGLLGADLGGTSVTNTSSSSDWTQVSVNFDSGSATSVDIYGAWNSAEGRFDEFTLEKISSGSPTEPPTNDPISCSGNESLNIVSATDDGTNDGNVPANTIDGVISGNSRWSSLGANKAIQYDLGGNANVKAVSIAWFKGNERTAFFEVETSADGSNWTPVLAAAQSSGTTTNLESYTLVESTGRFVKIIGQGNSSNNWNSIVETQIDGCTSGSQPTPPSTGLDPNLPPSGNFDLLDWTLSVPVDDNNDGKADTIKEIPLSSGYSLSPYFYTGSDGGLVFRSNVSGPKTSTNTSYTRSELREMLRRGDTNFATKGVNGNNWVFSSAPGSDRNNAGGVDGTLEATLAVNHVTTTGSSSQVGRVIIGQIHANDDEPVRIYYRKLPGNDKGAIYFAHEPNGGSDIYYEMIGSRSSSASTPTDGISLNEKFSYRIEVVGNQLTVTIMREGKPDVVETADMSNSGYDQGGQYMYFKAGVYNQNNTGNATDYAQATFYKIENKHTGYAF